MLNYETLISAIEVFLVTIPVLLIVAFVTVSERKTMASMQRRLGPNAIGYIGTLQAFADALKLLLKEFVGPTQANLILFFMGPLITLIFSLLGYAAMPYGTYLGIFDFNLGILYVLAVSSLSTYGILLAGLVISPLIMWIISKTSGELQEKLLKSQFEAKYSLIFLIYFVCIRYGIALIINKLGYWWDYKSSTTSEWDSRKINKFATSAWNLILIIIILLSLIQLNNTSIDLIILINIIYLYLIFLLNLVLSSLNCKTSGTGPILYNNSFLHISSKNPKIVNCKRYYSTSQKDKKYLSIEELKPLHNIYIKDLYKNRNAIVKPFEDKVLATCEDIDNKSEFIKKWKSVSCIYLIEYKHNTLVYYIGRTNLFQRRIYNHLQANTNNKFHIFLNLIGWQHFKISIVEIKLASELAVRENYYLQKYLPLLNTTFSSSFSETQIYETLTNKLLMLKNNNITPENGKAKEVYVYNILKDKIDSKYSKYKSIIQTNKNLEIARGTISLYMDTNIPFIGKLYYSQPILNLEEIFDLVKNVSKDLKLNSNIAQKVWAYDANTLELIKGSPFVSKTQASKFLGISRKVIDYFIDTDKADGVKGTYLYTKPLTDAVIIKLNSITENLQLGNKKKIWAYDANTFKLIDNNPFISLVEAAKYFNVNYRTITRHLDTKLSTMQNGKLVFLFKYEISQDLLEQLKNNISNVASYTRSAIWVYNLNKNKELVLLSNQPFRTKREALKELGIHLNILNQYLNTNKDYKGKLFYTQAQ